MFKRNFEVYFYVAFLAQRYNEYVTVVQHYD